MRAALVLVVALAGCGALETKPPDIVEKPTGVPCLKRKDVPAKPALVTDAELKAMRPDTFVLALYADRLKRIDYEAKLEATIEGCVGDAPIPGNLETKPPAEKPSGFRWPWSK